MLSHPFGRATFAQSDVLDVQAVRDFAKTYRACVCATQHYHDYIFSNVHMPRRLLEIQVDIVVDNQIVVALALIDIGATHTFMAHRFIKKNNIKTQTLQEVMRVHVANGSAIKTSERTSPVVMRIGKDYAAPTRFISLDLERYDILLGLDWLAKHDAVLYASVRKMVFYTKTKTARVEHTVHVERDAAPSSAQART